MDVLEHLRAIAEGRNTQAEHDEVAVQKLVGMNPGHRQPSKLDSRVQFLVDLTNRELAKEQNR